MPSQRLLACISQTSETLLQRFCSRNRWRSIPSGRALLVPIKGRTCPLVKNFTLTPRLAMPAVSSTSDPVPPVVEVKRKPRTLVLCFDGTTNEYDATNTNVVKLYSLLRKDKVEDQVCYYQAGIGTYFAPGVVSPLFRRGAQLLDKAFAWYLSEHVMEGYKFLMQNYNVGDKVCLFGFSRGAYTARALAGMLYKVGLLSKDNLEQVPFAYKLYKSTSPSDEALAQGFKATFSRHVPIEFVGVWDTVASVGLIMARTLPFVGVNTTIRVFRQALALDEHRAKFRPNLYHRSVPDKSSKKVDTPASSEPVTAQSGSDEVFDTDAREVWFSGCHSDVGGGNAPDTARNALSNIPLRWMIEQIVRAKSPILFDTDAFARWNIPTNIGETGYASAAQKQGASADGDGPEVDADPQDAQDAVQSITDELWKNPFWWILEIFPTSYTFQNARDKWVTTFLPHFGWGRLIPPGPLLHASVKLRMSDPRLKYKPKAHYEKGTEHYVS